MVGTSSESACSARPSRGCWRRIRHFLFALAVSLWLPVTAWAQGAPTTAANSASASIDRQNDYPVGEFRSVFDGSEPFLADHIIQGQKILPGMAYLEIARGAVAASAPPEEGTMLVLADSVFVNALTVKDKRTVTVRVYPGAAGQFGVEVITDQGVHFQSRVSVQNTAECLAARGTSGPSIWGVRARSSR